MKKILLIVITLALLAFTPPVHSSWYYAQISSLTGWALHQDLGWVNFTAAAVDVRSDGVMVLEDNIFVTLYTGLVNVSGSCRQDKPSHITLRLVIDGYSAPLVIADTSDAVFSFNVPVVAARMHLQGYNNDPGRYDVLKCALLIEKVQ